MSVAPGVGSVGYTATRIYPGGGFGSTPPSRAPDVTSIGNFTTAPDTRVTVSRLVQTAAPQTSTISQYTVTIQNNSNSTSLTGRLFLNGRVTTITTFTPAQYAELTYASGQVGSTDRITVSVTASGVTSTPVQLISTVSGANSGNVLGAIQPSAPAAAPAASSSPAPEANPPAPTPQASATPSLRDLQSGFRPQPAPGTVTYSISAAGAARVGIGGSSVSVLSSSASPSLFDQLYNSVRSSTATSSSSNAQPSFTLSANPSSAISLSASAFNPATPSYSSTSLIPSLHDILAAQSTESSSNATTPNYSLQHFGALSYLKAQTLFSFTAASS